MTKGDRLTIQIGDKHVSGHVQFIDLPGKIMRIETDQGQLVTLDLVEELDDDEVAN